MKAFLRKLIFWICSGLLFAACIEWLAGNEQNDYARKYEVLKHAEADTLILGSSHSFYGLKANGLDIGGSYNMSWSSQTLDESFWLANEAPSQTHIFICISPFTLASTVNNRVELWRNAYFNRTFHWISSNPKELSFFLSLGGRNILKMARNGINKIGPSRIDVAGNGNREGSVESLAHSADEACARHFRNATSKKLEQLLIELSKRQNTTFFTPPFHQSYLDCVAEENSWQQTLSVLDSLKRVRPIKYLNYSALQLPDSCFYDADHLNRYGQMAFSEILFRNEEKRSLSRDQAVQLP